MVRNGREGSLAPYVSISILVLTLIVSALTISYFKYYSRGLFNTLHGLQKEIDSLEVEWGKLQLEQSTWGAQSRVVYIAEHQLNMVAPDTDKIIVINP